MEQSSGFIFGPLIYTLVLGSYWVGLKFNDAINLFVASDAILLATMFVIASQAWETRRLVELTRIKDQPFLEIEFQNKGAEVLLKNLGQSPAYSPSVTSIEIAGNEHLYFDPLYTSRLPILPGESREVWMHHQRVGEGSTNSFAESAPVLKNFVINQDSPIKITLRYFDKNGEKLYRDLFIKVGGNKISGDQQIYTSTSPES